MPRDVVHGKVVAFHWKEGQNLRTLEVTAEVEHADGTRTLLVLPVDRMSFRLPAKKRKRRADDRERSS